MNELWAQSKGTIGLKSNNNLRALYIHYIHSINTIN